MAKLSFQDKIPANDFAGLKFTKMHGHTKITLHDVKTGKDEIYEDDNLVTLAVPKIFKTNWFGLSRFDRVIPMQNLFGGVMCFQDAMTESTSNIFPPSKVNPMIANAGQTTHATASTTRGNPNGAASEVDPATRTVKFVWDWTLEQGNGTISTVCLTNAAAGDCGLYPDGTLPLWDVNITPAINNVTFYRASTIGGTWSEDIAKTCPVGFDADGDGICLYLDGTTFKEMKVRHPWYKAGMIEQIYRNDLTNFKIISTRTATTSRTFATNYYQIGQDDNNYYVIERDSSDNTKLFVDTISKTDMSVTSATLTISGATLARPEVTGSRMNNAIISNGSVYIVSGSDSKTFVRVNLTNAADVQILDSNMANDIILHQMPFVASNNLVLGYNYLINGDTVYPVAARPNRTDAHDWLYNFEFESIARFENSPFVFQGIGTTDTNYDRWNGEGGMLFLPYLATVNVLGAPVTKTNTKTMRVEYTLTEV